MYNSWSWYKKNYWKIEYEKKVWWLGFKRRQKDVWVIGCRKIEVDETERSEDIKADTWMDV